MFSKNSVQLYVAALMLAGVFFMASSQLGNSQEIQPGCCQYGLEEGELSCIETGGVCPKVLPGTSFDGFFPDETCNEDTGLCSGIVSEVPTLSEWGLIATAGILGIAGFMVIRRKRIAA